MPETRGNQRAIDPAQMETRHSGLPLRDRFELRGAVIRPGRMNEDMLAHLLDSVEKLEAEQRRGS